MRSSRIRRAFFLSLTIAGLAVLPPSPSTAAQEEPAEASDSGPGADLIEAAQKRFPIDDISGPDAKGQYKLPKPAGSADAREARRLFTQAVAVGNTEAHRFLGEMIEAGTGGPQDFAAARKHYAAAGDNRYAQWRLGLLLAAGRGGTADFPAARALFRRSSDAGQVDASYEYARMMELGLGGAKDPAAARALHKSNTEWCHGDIADRYSIMLMKGIGGPVDRTGAAEFQVKAFECHNSNFATPAALANPTLFDRATIVEIQKRLRDEGYEGPLDGQFNAATIAALKALI